jgi:hypothetical protein
MGPTFRAGDGSRTREANPWGMGGGASRPAGALVLRVSVLQLELLGAAEVHLGGGEGQGMEADGNGVDGRALNCAYCRSSK